MTLCSLESVDPTQLLEGRGLHPTVSPALVLETHFRHDTVSASHAHHSSLFPSGAWFSFGG